jgi:pyruvate/2-oxoglutarate dehydrogenase complex dihydrolipoamide acyltransferase (E2) component
MLLRHTNRYNTLFRLYSTEVIKLRIPDINVLSTFPEGVIAKWNIPEGAKVRIGDVIYEIENDKGTICYES